MFAIRLIIHRAIRLVIRCSVRHLSLHFHSFSTIFGIQTSLLKVRRAVSHSQFTIRRAIRCRFSMSPDAFHRLLIGWPACQ